MNEAKKLEPYNVPVLVDAHSLSAPATPIPTTGDYRVIPAPRSFIKNFFIMSFWAGTAGFLGGIVLTILILQGKLDFDKSAIKAFFRFLSGH